MPKKKKNYAQGITLSWEECTTPQSIQKKVARKFRDWMNKYKKLSDFPDVTSYIDLVEPYLSRRIQAVSNYIQKYREQYGALYPNTPVESIFVDSALSARVPMDTRESLDYVSVAAALWILDALKASGNLSAAISLLPEVGTVLTSMPTLYTPGYSNEVLNSMVYLIQRRYVTSQKSREEGADEARYIFSPTAVKDRENAPMYSRFSQLLDLIPDALKHQAAENFREKCRSWFDSYIGTYKHYLDAEEAAEDQSAGLLELVDDMAPELMAQIRSAKIDSANVGPMAPFSITTNVLKSPKALKVLCTADDIKKHREEALRAQNLLRAWAIEASRMDRDFLQKRLEPDVIDLFHSFPVEEPYETCFALLYLIELDDDLPWLYSVPQGVVNAAVAKLPWTYDQYDDSGDPYWDSPDEGGCPSSTDTDWYDLKYRDPNWRKAIDLAGGKSMPAGDRNLAQLVYQLTGCVMPGNTHRYDGVKSYLRKCGVTQAQTNRLMGTLVMMGECQRTTQAWEGFDDFKDDWDKDGDDEDFDTDEGVEELHAEIERLKAENDRLRRTNHEISREVREATVKAERANAQIEVQRQELTDLRDLVFRQQEDGYEEEAPDESIHFPYETKHRIVAYGGHDSWLREIKFKLPEVRFLGKDMLPNEELIRRADVVWIQPNAISHGQFYKIIDVVRKNNIPVRYFSYASATKCAEQVVKEDRRQEKE